MEKQFHLFFCLLQFFFAYAEKKEKTLAESDELYVGREEKLNHYQIIVRPGLKTLTAIR